MRKAGYYWVKVDVDGWWEPAQYDPDMDFPWTFLGCDAIYKEHEISEIDERPITHA